MSSESAAEIVVRRSVTVPVDPDRAFELFTTQMGSFWPSEHSIGTAKMAEVVVEPRASGRWFERGVDGSEFLWGRVGAWEPPGRVVLVWQIGADWQFDPGLETEVEIAFSAETGGRTRVDLQHRHLERYGDSAEDMRVLFESPGAWEGTLSRFADFTA